MQPRHLLAFLALLLAAPSSHGQEMGTTPTRHALSGYIREEGSGHVVGAARVELQNNMGTPISTTYSDGNGSYGFGDIPGDCYVAVQHDGYAPAREFIHPDGSPHFYKDVYIRVQPAGSASSAGNPVSQHELSIPPKAKQSFDKGLQLVVERSDYRAALAEFSKAIEKYPSYYEAYAAMGLAQEKIGDASAAEASLRKSVELSEQKYPQALIDLASFLNGRHRFSEAEPFVRTAAALDTSSWRAQYELATALAGQRRFREALTSASASRDLKSDNPQIYLALYNLHIETDNFPAAVADADAYLKLKPDGAMAEKVRKMRDQLQKALQNSSGPAPAPSHPH